MLIFITKKILHEIQQSRVLGMVKDVLPIAGIVMTLTIDEDQLCLDIVDVAKVSSQVIDEHQRIQSFDRLFLRIAIEIIVKITRADHLIDRKSMASKIFQAMFDESSGHRRDTDQLVPSLM